MPILIERIDELDINCLIWVGEISRSEALGFPARIDPSLPEFGCRWISYFDSGADLSDLNPESLLDLRKRLKPVVAALAAKGEFKAMLVSNSRYNDPLLEVWQAIVATDPAYPSAPVFMSGIHDAARALGLSEADAERLWLWIQSRIAGVSGD